MSNLTLSFVAGIGGGIGLVLGFALWIWFIVNVLGR